MVDKLIRLILQLLPNDVVSIINEQSLDELDKRGWIIWGEKDDENRPLD
ncbi:MAG: hypothetical protein HC773_03230 [Scytonema sp. CRU_2_7]|nr:hypothetical protein [Scytonema sp. CRU_2_7]